MPTLHTLIIRSSSQEDQKLVVLIYLFEYVTNYEFFSHMDLFLCSAASTRKKLKIHQNNVHDDRRFKCETCGRECIGNKGLKNHERTHRITSPLVSPLLSATRSSTPTVPPPLVSESTSVTSRVKKSFFFQTVSSQNIPSLWKNTD